MPYFTHDFIDFFTELKDNNHRDWFHANKKRYENSVKKPFVAFLDDMIERVREEEPEVTISPKEAMFRINRDIRFSKDKSPYKTHMAAVISEGGRKNMQNTRPGMYLQLSAENLGFYGGAYQPDKENLLRIRTHIIDHMEDFQSALDDPDFKNTFGTIHGDKNKRLPKEFQEAAEQQPLLYNKGFYYFVELPADTILREDLIEVLMDYYAKSGGVRNFIADAILK